MQILESTVHLLTILFTTGLQIHNPEWEAQARLISESVLMSYHILKRGSECPKFKNGRNEKFV